MPISPELALVDRELAELARASDESTVPATEPSANADEHDAREAMLRMCELSDVNPPRNGRRVVAVAAPAALWAEVVLFVASFVPFGTL